jgi:hypothetical protein
MSIELFSPVALRTGDGALAVLVTEEVERALERQGRVV